MSSETRPCLDGDATTCPYGHETLSSAIYCHVCGMPLDPDPLTDSPAGQARRAAAETEAAIIIGDPRDEILRALRGVEEALSPEVEE